MKKILIIGGGPAGLTAAYELLQKEGYIPVVLEADKQVGGISKTIQYQGNRMDIGGHRFFSKSDWVMDWWAKILPYSKQGSEHAQISYQNKQREIELSDDTDGDNIMLLRPRLSRIYFLKKFFDYPVKLNVTTVSNLGLWRMLKIGVSYIYIRLFPIKQPTNLEEFFISRFGNELYLTFFKDYTEKVWGTSCKEISAEWGAQRIKGLSITKTLIHAFKSLLPSKNSADIRQKGANTSLIEQFLYPKFGPGQMWECVADEVTKKGGEVLLHHTASEIILDADSVKSVKCIDQRSGETKQIDCDYVISTMPVRNLMQSLKPEPPKEYRKISDGLIYRDFMTAGILVSKLKKSKYSQDSATNMLPDNWIYIQEREVKVGRLQIFNNWSPFLVQKPDTVWLGMEYFCDEGDELWNMEDEKFLSMAINELETIGLIEAQDVLDKTLIRVEKAYPAYFGTYDQFPKLQQYIDSIDNLFLVGRNGMHRYNNQDHSMLTAKLAVEAILTGSTDKAAIWNVNIDDDYHEEDNNKT